ncbi:hypothetical protein ACWIUD_08295 [Helicobacter sp. 23-1044]
MHFAESNIWVDSANFALFAESAFGFIDSAFFAYFAESALDSAIFNLFCPPPYLAFSKMARNKKSS